MTQSSFFILQALATPFVFRWCAFKFVCHSCVSSLQDNKKAELKQRIETSKNKVQAYTSSIDGMRVSRDSKIEDINGFQNEVQDLNQKLQMVQAENLQLEGQVAIQNNSMGKFAFKFAVCCPSVCGSLFLSDYL